VADKFIMQLEEQLADRNVTIELTDEARKWLAKKGYDPKFGARPLARVIQENIKKPLAEELLFGKLEKGGSVQVKLGKDGKLSFNFQKRPPAGDKPGGKSGSRRRPGSGSGKGRGGKKKPAFVE
jgi:ATP-dependent Clp protease ATP-binding subunit ClpA